MEKSPNFLEEVKNPLHENAELLNQQYKNIDDLVLEVAKFIRKNTQGHLKPRTLLESRLTSATDAFKKKIYSCGTSVTMVAEMLRHVGIEVKLIHGECKESEDHAWISVKNPESGEWKEYDIARNNGIVPETNIKKFETDSWEDVKDKLTLEYETREDRRKARAEKSEF